MSPVFNNGSRFWQNRQSLNGFPQDQNHAKLVANSVALGGKYGRGGET
jgi:hypothetical protein